MQRIVLQALLVVGHTLLSHAQSEPSYAPSYVPCPADLRIRPACEGLNSDEQAWRGLRNTEVVKALPQYLATANIPNFDIDGYMKAIDSTNVPVSGLAISGGGSQSGMGGLGIWQAMDERYQPAVEAGTGGLAQCLTYLTGLSGGGLNTVLPLAANNYSSLEDLRETGNLTSSYINGLSGNVTAHFESIYKNMGAKALNGFRVGMADVLGQWFIQYLSPSWRNKSMSDLAAPETGFSNGLGPLPIITLSEVIPGSSPEVGNIMYPDVNSSPAIYEQTPFEFGCWAGGRVQAFIKTKFLGSAMTNGAPKNASICVNGFDKFALAQGSTGNAWNFWLIDDFYKKGLFWKRAFISAKRQDPGSSIPIPPAAADSPDVQVINQTATIFKQTFNETLWASYPNPFNNFSPAMKDVSELLIVDGSENSETLPLRPLIIPERKLDFIIAYDSSGEEVPNSWVNGTTFARSALAAKQLGYSFPDIPDPAIFVNLELNKYPTFFGCSDSSSSSPSSETPLILYLPNAPWSAYSNYSFRTAEFSERQLDLVFNNSLNIVTNGGANTPSPSAGTPPLSTCIACGLIYKSLQRTQQAIPDACKSCFERHCWNGTIADAPKQPLYDPALILNPGLGYEQWNSTEWYAA